MLAFGADAGAAAWLAAPWLLPAALLTLSLGMLGVLAARRLGQLASFAVIGSMGLLLTGIALFTPTALSAALYYLLHSTLAGRITSYNVCYTKLLRDERVTAMGTLAAGAAHELGTPLATMALILGELAGRNNFV